jgi:NADH:ubiquinone oxidoreductase subunit 5 (subunit L)/multisubunit Na+/H+ antiporter MnhA subunit
LTPKGLAGVAVYVVGHGLTKAALFMCAGVLLHRFATTRAAPGAAWPGRLAALRRARLDCIACATRGYLPL